MYLFVCYALVFNFVIEKVHKSNLHTFTHHYVREHHHLHSSEYDSDINQTNLIHGYNGYDNIHMTKVTLLQCHHLATEKYFYLFRKKKSSFNWRCINLRIAPEA